MNGLRILSRSLLLTNFFYLAGCGGGGGGGGENNPGPPDVSAPSVSSMSPGEDVSQIGINSKISVAFSEAMLASDISPENFRLTNEDNSIPGTVRYDTRNKIAVFTPTVTLTPNTRYTATIVTGIRDLAANSLSNDFAWCFVTGPAPDDTAPSVTSTLPLDAATDVSVNAKLSATFNEEIDTASFAAGGFSVSRLGASIPGTVTYLGRTAVFKPKNNFAPNASYTATLTGNVLDMAGNALQPTMSWSFTTGASTDTLAPLVISTNPANAATGVPISSVVSATFNEPMDPTTIITANFVVSTAGENVIGTVEFDANTNTATFTRINHQITPVVVHDTPVHDFEPNTTYTVRLTRDVKDMAGKALASNVDWSFTTAP